MTLFRSAAVELYQLLALVFLGFACEGLAAPGLPDRHVVQDGGQPRDFETATDELGVLGPNQRVLTFERLDSAEAVRQRAEALRQTAGEEVALVLYKHGLPRHEFTRRLLTRQVIMQLAEGVEASAVARAVGAGNPEPVAGLAGWFQLETPEVAGALSLAGKLRRQPGVLYAQAQLAGQKQKKLLPNDTYFSQQWHLLNTGQNGGTPGIDINITNVWDRWRGAGVMIGIVDDGLQLTHPDLAANVNTSIDWDFNGYDADPSPNLRNDTHGTPVAGVAAGRGNNGQGIVGVAYEATLVGLRLLGGTDTDVQDAAAMLHSNALIQVKNNSWGAYDGDGALEGPGPLMAAALAQGTTSGRGGKGTIYVFAGGNGLQYRENVNYDGFANSIHVFAVGAVTDQGFQAGYSEPGACLVVTAPSSDFPDLCSGRRQGITTTDLVGQDGENKTGATCELADRDYTQGFSGTSAATPVVSGVIALVLQANPNLSHRDVKEILMRSATKVSVGDADWSTNSAGIPHNHKFGAGMVNAGRAVNLATNWANLGPVSTLSLVQTNLNVPIPDNDPNGITRTFNVSNANFRVENVTLTVTIPHTFYGDLAITLTSPSGRQSQLAEKHSSPSYGYDNWTLNSLRHWGEKAQGTWTVKIADLAQQDIGTLNYLKLGLYGSTPQANLSIARAGQNTELTLRAAAAGWTYALDASTNFANWTQLATLQVRTDGKVNYPITNPSNPWRFYRARLLP